MDYNKNRQTNVCMGGAKSSLIDYTIHPNIYKYTNSLVDTKLFCHLLREVTL
jgi:hypothetical protein